mgnify:CR=1 FL=1
MYHLLEYLEASAARFPDKEAFADTGKSITFSQLQTTARAIGTAIARATGPRRGVAVCMDKGVDAVSAFLGALYAGCFYCYLDPKSPQARMDAMLGSLNPGFMVLSDKGPAPAADCPAVPFSQLAETPPDEALLALRRREHIDLDPAYCSFTSGSTGTPKGVLVSHRSVIDFIDEFTQLFSITEQDVTACQSPFDFDVSVKDIFSGLKTGAKVVLIPKFYFVFLPNLLELLEQHRVTTLIWAVSALCLLSERDALSYQAPGFLNKFIFSGEVMPPRHLLYWKEHYPQARFINVYGPTEITCNCTYYLVTRRFDADETIPMGKPFANERVLLLDERDHRIDGPGVTGEVCVMGTALALGYLGAPELMSASFVHNPANARWLEPMYRTGDLARYDENGDLVYVSRKDLQVKHLGQRIELGDIEAAAHAVAGVERACCLYDSARKRIKLYYMGDLDRRSLKDALRERLPSYMVPNNTRMLDELPLNKNGKIDRAALARMR